jgi:hypothetical protein
MNFHPKIKLIRANKKVFSQTLHESVNRNYTLILTYRHSVGWLTMNIERNERWKIMDKQRSKNFFSMPEEFPTGI